MTRARASLARRHIIALLALVIWSATVAPLLAAAVGETTHVAGAAAVVQLAAPDDSAAVQSDHCAFCSHG